MEEKYNAGIMSQSFWFVEFKRIALMRHSGVSYEEIQRQCIEENLFGAVNPTRERRMCQYLLKRLRTMDDRLLDVFASADIQTQKIINLITVLNLNTLYFEFVYEIYRTKLLTGEKDIGLVDCNVFFSQKESQNEDLASWKEATKKRVKSLFLNFLYEADMVKWSNESKKQRIVNKVFVSSALEAYLKSTNINMYKAIEGVS